MKSSSAYALLLLLLAGCAQSWTLVDDGGGDVPNETPDTTSDAADTPVDLPTDEPAGDGACPPGLDNCGGACVDLRTEHDHCGTCGRACEPAEVCFGGECLLECPDDTIACSGSCVDISSDVINCGECDNVCAVGEHAEPVCEMGVCAVICEAGWSDLDDDGSCETNCVSTSSSETCNGLDDNCDGTVDESFPCRMGREVGCTTVCDSTGTGICGIDCEIPAPGLCNPPGEACNGADDDCDDQCDNAFACCRGDTEPCTSSCGTPGTAICSATCERSGCIPPDETCNGLDDDCDGDCDDGAGMACCSGEESSCTTSCGSTGSRTCSGSCTWNTCEPPAETCNGADDDCDDRCDNGFDCCRGAAGTCTASCGSTGSRTCSGSCAWGSCQPPAETCNGADDDCDDQCDNGFACCRGAAGTCTTSCGSTGTRTCSSSCSWSSCDPPGETLNFEDDDCDTIVDNGYSVLAHGYDDCAGSSGSCPPGYSSRGSFKVDSQSCGSAGSTGIDYDGHAMDAGWLHLCSPTNDVILAHGWDDCASTGGGCPSGYTERASFKVDTIECGSPGHTGLDYDGYSLESGWMHLCSKTSNETIALQTDSCTMASGDCPGGSSMQGRWKPDASACNPTYPSAITTDGHRLNVGWIRYCVDN